MSLGAVGVEITFDDVDRSHRAKPFKAMSSNMKPRDIIVKFVSYRARSKLLSNKSQFKVSKFKGVYLNEDLTHTHNLLFQQTRKLVKDKIVSGTWTVDGVIMIKDKSDNKARIETKKDLDSFLSKL